MGEAVHVWGQQVYKKSLYLPQNSVVDLKLLQKVKKKSRGHCDDKNASSFTRHRITFFLLLTSKYQ